MKKLLALAGVTLSLLMSVARAQDPGAPDRVWIEGGPLQLNSSLPLDVVISNDLDVYGMFIGLLFETLDSGFARVDSVVWVNRMADPIVLNARGDEIFDELGVSPDSMRFGGARIGANTPPLPPGHDAVARIYMTGLTTGRMSIDGRSFPRGGTFLFIPPGSLNAYTPAFSTATIIVEEGSPPPTVTATTPILRDVAGSSFDFQVDVTSPIGAPLSYGPVTVTLEDDSTTIAVNPAQWDLTSSPRIEWVSAPAETGVWSVRSSVSDSTGATVDVSLQAQVVAGESNLMSFVTASIDSSVHTTGLAHANLDDDPFPEIVATGDISGYT
ncbi:MAG: hypothetical protein ACE5GA_11475, partial [Candidatus Zixiibacteriota bacterium]